MRRPSLAFVSALVGIALTILSWYGPWEWPAWPAFAVMDVALGSRANFADLSYRTKSIAVVILIIINVTTWGLVAAACIAAMRRLRQSDSSS